MERKATAAKVTVYCPTLLLAVAVVSAQSADLGFVEWCPFCLPWLLQILMHRCLLWDDWHSCSQEVTGIVLVFLFKPLGGSCQPLVASMQCMSPSVVSGRGCFLCPIKAFLTEDQAPSSRVFSIPTQMCLSWPSKVNSASHGYRHSSTWAGEIVRLRAATQAGCYSSESRTYVKHCA